MTMTPWAWDHGVPLKSARSTTTLLKNCKIKIKKIKKIFEVVVDRELLSGTPWGPAHGGHAWVM